MTIKEARKAAGLTQQALSDWLGIPNARSKTGKAVSVAALLGAKL